MEEVYIIKLKGLPLKDADAARKPSFIANDLSVEVTLGFAFFHIVLGIISMTFGFIFLVAFDLEEEWRASVQGLGCGVIFVFTGSIGIWSSSQRRQHLAQAKDSIKIFLLASLLSMLTSASFILLTAAGVTISANIDSSRAHLLFHLTLSLVVELINGGFSALTSCKIIWPMKFNCYSRHWPTQSKVKKKVIVSTNIYARGLYDSQNIQDHNNFQRFLGPNCVVSLASPDTKSTQRRGHHKETSLHQIVNEDDHHIQDLHQQINHQEVTSCSTPSPVPSSSHPSSSSGYCPEEESSNHPDDQFSETEQVNEMPSESENEVKHISSFNGTSDASASVDKI